LSWDFLPTARWIFEFNGRPVADFDWWVNESSSADAELLG